MEKKRRKNYFFLRLSYQLLRKSSWLRYLAEESFSMLKHEKERSTENQLFEMPRFEGRWIDSFETQPDNEEELVKNVVSSFNLAKENQKNVDAPYLPSGKYAGFFEERLEHFYDVMRRRDHEVAAKLLRNFFRTPLVSGVWSGDFNVFETFCELDEYVQRKRELEIIEQYRVWRNALNSVNLKELDAPRFGNPWGYRFNDYLLYEPVFIYNFQAHYFSRLLKPINRPVVIEIGGGFGGLAHHLMRCCPRVTYVGYDLPESIAIQTYYLSCIFPYSRILTYQEDTPPITLETLNEYDFILLPNYELKRADSQIADLIVNVRGFNALSPETICEYFSQIDRLGRLFFYHENLFKERKDGEYCIPCSDYPSLRNFVQIYARESRWPIYRENSNYPCQENLFLRSSLISDTDILSVLTFLD